MPHDHHNICVLGYLLETLCTECLGKGATFNTYNGDRYGCEYCDETGYVLTEKGEDVYAFLTHTIERMKNRRPFDSSIEGCSL